MDKILGSLTEVLEGVLQADQQLMEKAKAKVFSALITVLQMKEMRGEQAVQAPAPMGPCVLSGNLQASVLLPTVPSPPSSKSPSLSVHNPRSSPA